MAEYEWNYHDFNDVGTEDKLLSNPFDNKLVYMASVLAKQLKLEEYDDKIFAMALSQLDFYKTGDDFSVELSVLDVAEKLENKPDESFYTNLRKRYRALIKKTVVSFDLPNGDFLDGALIETIHSTKRTGKIKIIFNDKFKPALQYCKIAYTKIPLDDCLAYKSKYASILQRYLTAIYRTDKNSNLIQTFDFSTKQLKEVFGLGEKEYCKKNGKFDRYNFEKKTIDAACTEINEKSQVMQVSWKKAEKKRPVVYLINCTIATKIKKKPPVVETKVEEEQMSIDDFGF